MNENITTPPETKVPNRFLAFVKRDLLYIVVCVFALLACAYTYNHVDTYVAECNQHWENQLSNCSCLCSDGKFIGRTPTTLPDIGGYLNENHS